MKNKQDFIIFVKNYRLLLVISILQICQCLDNGNPLVNTPLGKLRGVVKISHGGRRFTAFEGIPYAKPPVGDRRFKEAEPIQPWDGIIEVANPTKCAQTVMVNPNTIIGQEDCLHLNVYVPRAQPDPNEKLDVIIHIHGGAFMYGSGHSYAHPHHLMDRNVIFVTFNYRLNFFGFLSTEDEVVSGNNGLKDQVLAMKWVHNNIASFGGDPESVTLTGLSAGGASVHLHYFSEMSKGLFHRGFSQSGCALNHWTIQEQPLTKAKILGEAVGCPTNSTLVLVECLKQKPYKELLEKMSLFFTYLFIPIVTFGPVIEKGSKPFLAQNPYILLTQGQVKDLPWMTSNVAHEGLLPTAYMKNDLERIDREWANLAPIFLDYNYTLPQSKWKSTAEQIKFFYLGENQTINSDHFMSFVQIFSDRHFLVDSEDAVRLQVNVTESPVYYYQFNYPGDADDKNVAHGNDRKYFFGNLNPISKPLSSNELKMKDLVLDILVSFAKTGKPTIDKVDWEPLKYDKLKYLQIDGVGTEHVKMKISDKLAPRIFWKSLNFLENENLLTV